MELRERDFRIFREVERWRFCLGRHIKTLAGFSSQRTCDRRLRMLILEKYLIRHKVLYGVPNMYGLTSKAKTLIHANKRIDKIRLDQIIHDVTVLDVAVCFINSLGLGFGDLKTEKQLHQDDGFGVRTHHPDFIFKTDDKTYCVEVELSLKSKARLEKNIKSNFRKYDVQIWVVDENATKLIRTLEHYKLLYANIEITNVKEVQDDVIRFIT